jgi:hypothetical protein
VDRAVDPDLDPLGDAAAPGSMRMTAPCGSTAQTDPSPAVRSQQTSPASTVTAALAVAGSTRNTEVSAPEVP